MTRSRGELRYEPIEKRVRASAGADTLVDTTRAVLLWEPRRICPDLRRPFRRAPRRAGAGRGE